MPWPPPASPSSRSSRTSPFSRRVAYVGVDNRAAGATAAYLVTQWSAPEPGGVLVTLSSATFRGEEEREVGFRATLRELAPSRSVVEVTDTDGLDSSMLRAVGEALAADPSLDAVYSIGGGNTATLAAFRAAGRTPSVFVAHDLDGDNRALLRSRQISAVLHHDLRADMRRACRAILQAQGALPGVPVSVPVPDPGRDALQRTGRPRRGRRRVNRRVIRRDQGHQRR